MNNNSLENNILLLINRVKKMYPEISLIELEKLYLIDYEKFFLLVGIMLQYKEEITNDEINVLWSKIIELDSKKCKYLNTILKQIAILNYDGLNKLIDCIKDVDNVEVDEYIKTEYDRIIQEWVKTDKGKYFDIPSGEIRISINENEIKTLVGKCQKDDRLYDIASMTKLYTEVLLFRIINSGDYGIMLDTKINVLTDKYPNLPDDFKIRDLIEFKNNYRTNKNIKDSGSRKEAIDNLRTSRIIEVVRGGYLYTDIPIMILTDVLELVTGKDYKDLLTEYVLEPFDLKDTYLGKLNKKDKCRYVLSYDEGVNDPKANYMGGYYGHAGIKCTCSDWIKFLNAMINSDIILNDRILFELFGMGMAKYPLYDLSGKKITNYKENQLLEKELNKIGYSLTLVSNLVKDKKDEELLTLIEDLKKLEKEMGYEDNYLLDILYEYLDFIVNYDKHLIMEGASRVGNVNVASDHFKYGDISLGSLASDTISHYGGEVQGSTRVHGGVCKYRIEGVDYVTSLGIFLDIASQVDNARVYDRESGATKIIEEYETKELGKIVSMDPRSIISYNGAYGEIRDMVGRARLMELYKLVYTKEKKRVR